MNAAAESSSSADLLKLARRIRASLGEEEVRRMDRVERERLVVALREAELRQSKDRFYRMYPDEGPLRRELYRHHLEIFRATRDYDEVLAQAGNRSGKTELGAYMTAVMLTGLYPDWWEGRRFDRPVKVWSCGKTNEKLVDVNMEKLFGGATKTLGRANRLLGTGMIPSSHIIHESARWVSQYPGLLKQVHVRYRDSDSEFSVIALKGYESGRGSFEGTSQELIHCDEEPPLDVYSECTARLTTVNGVCLLTFTPLEGYSDVVNLFMPTEMRGLEDVPHSTPEQIRKLMQRTPPHLREARLRGEPVAGEGRIYQIALERLTVPPFSIPPQWPRGYAIDPGLRFAAIFGALDPASDILYLYSEYKEPHLTNEVHAQVIRGRGGKWMRGTIDPSATKDRSPKDMITTAEQLGAAGLTLSLAENPVRAGINTVEDRMMTGRLKVFETLVKWKAEYGRYIQKDGKIPNGQEDHLMDATRYLVVSGIPLFRCKPGSPMPGWAGGGDEGQPWPVAGY